jgi:hypothetical protein
MQMFRQNNPSVDLKRVAFSNLSDYFAQQIDLAYKQIIVMSL